ncbi:MAG: DNA polymerase I [Proteobacteria bacterium]|nr:DNA polymerase I [Pseudomonadota bacterium]MBU4472282.1 DNA polymerase I [Pseudomonadota bacterium]MCG2751978.1 DNA polymerase I [Desulfobacteraceae bacterium]
MEKSKTLYLIDGSAYIHRAYHAIQSLANSKGLPTNAAFGFARMLIKLVKDKTPEYAAMFFDAKGPTFRHAIYDAYKANRPPMPEDMAAQIPYIKSITQGFNLPIFEQTGFEADDLMGSMARIAEENGFDVVMVTGDKDFIQLVTGKTTIWDPMKDETRDLQSVKTAFGVTPEQMIEVMGLSGDTADNIPGVPGIGQKTALGLIQDFGNLENLYDHIQDITKKKQKENLLTYKDQAFLSRKLATIDRSMDLPFEPDHLVLSEPDSGALSDLFRELEFRQLQQEFFAEATKREKAYHGVMDEAHLVAMIQQMEKAGSFALDTETTSEDPMRAKLVGLSFSSKPDEAFYIPCGHIYEGAPRQLEMKTVLDTLAPLLENPAYKKIGQNIKYDWMVLLRHGIKLDGIFFDTMLASYLINPSKRAHNLDQIALDFLNHKTIKFSDLVGKDKNASLFSEVRIEDAVDYACEDADITLSVKAILEPKLEGIGLQPLFQTVEMPLIPVLLRMEMQGICVDREKLKSLSRSYEKELTRIEQDVFELAGEEFNIKSSQQLGTILFEKLGLPVQKKTQKKTGYSTDVDVLTTLAELHPLPERVLRHRTLAKLKSTYTDNLIDLIHPETGRIHTSYNQTVTATGRLSSSDPNLQNIPIRTEEGREIRSAFVPRPGWHMVSADYSQVELRILAHCSNDPILIKAFLEDEDIHTRTANEVFQVFPEMITPELRRQAKIINFGILYGMGAFSLSKQLGISQKMGKNYIDNYFSRYKGVKQFIDQTIEEARKTQKTSTLLGRIRMIPDINSANNNVRGFAERIAVNTPIQGSAADLIKLAMIQVDRELQDRKLQTAMLLTVHDELVFETPPEELGLVMDRVKTLMEGVWDLKVPLKVNIAWGENWSSAH